MSCLGQYCGCSGPLKDHGFHFAGWQVVSPEWDVLIEPADESGHWQCLRRRLYAKAKMAIKKLRLAVREGRRR